MIGKNFIQTFSSHEVLQIIGVHMHYMAFLFFMQLPFKNRLLSFFCFFRILAQQQGLRFPTTGGLPFSHQQCDRPPADFLMMGRFAHTQKCDEPPADFRKVNNKSESFLTFGFFLFRLLCSPILPPLVFFFVFFRATLMDVVMMQMR